MTKVVKEDKLYDQAYRGLASRGLQSPFLSVPLRGTPLPPNHNPGFQPWVVPAWGHPCPCGCRPSRKEMAVTKVVKEDKLYDQTYGAPAARRLGSPLVR